MSERPEVLFVHAYLLPLEMGAIGSTHPLPPLAPAEAAAWVKQETGATVELWDPTFRLDVRSFDVAVSRRRPRVTWIYTHPTTRVSALSMVELARNSGAVVVAGGPDAQLRPALYLQAGADAVVGDEGEDATAELIRALGSSHWRAAPKLLARVPGLHYLADHGTVRESAGKARLIDLSRMPRPLREPEQTRIHLERWASLGLPRTLAVRSARGCPVNCGFCTRVVFNRPYRRRAPNDVAEELEELTRRFDVGRFRFADELFLFDTLWLREFAQEVKRRDLHLRFEGTAHPAMLDRDVLGALADVGLVRLDLHAASGCDELLKELDWSYRPDHIYRAASAIRDAGIGLGLQVLVGLPGEGRDALDASMEMVRIVRPEAVEVTRVDPGSPALFRKDWQRVVEGPYATRGRGLPRLPSTALESAVLWMRSVGSRDRDAVADRARGLLVRAGRPLLRAWVRVAPGVKGRGL
jgi:radical SAM superfamily enzyme YgiQ (UPF0313 family)